MTRSRRGALGRAAGRALAPLLAVSGLARAFGVFALLASLLWAQAQTPEHSPEQGPTAPPEAAEFLGAVVSPWPAWWPGGLSGLLVDPDGMGFFAVSDNNFTVRAVIRRHEDGRIRDIRYTGRQELVSPRWTWGPYYSDAEGLARGPDATLIVAYESWNRVILFEPDGRYRATLPEPALFQDLPINAGLEAVAALPDGRILTIPEAWPPDPARRPIFAFDGTAWSVAAMVAVDQGFVPVGLDVDGRGRLYLLERAFQWRRGFSTRIRRFEPIARGGSGPETPGLGPEPEPETEPESGPEIAPSEMLLQTEPGRFGNLEGLSLWRRADGALIALMIADNNFLPLVLPRQLVEFRLPD